MKDIFFSLSRDIRGEDRIRRITRTQIGTTAEVKEQDAAKAEEDKGMKTGKYSGPGSIVMPRLPQSILQERWTRAESEVRFLAEVLSLAFTTKRRKDTPSSSGAVFPAPVAGFFLPRDARRS